MTSAEILTDKILADIQGGVYGRSGELFPTFRALAAHYGTCHATTAKALESCGRTDIWRPSENPRT